MPSDKFVPQLEAHLYRTWGYGTAHQYQSNFTFTYMRFWMAPWCTFVNATTCCRCYYQSMVLLKVLSNSILYLCWIHLPRSDFLSQNNLSRVLWVSQVPNAHSNSPGIESIFAVIRKSNHAHFLTSFCSDKVNVLWHKSRRCKGKGLSFMLKLRRVALSAPSGCVPQAAQCLAGAIFTIRVTPPISPRLTLSAVAEPISRGKSPRKWHHQQFSWCIFASIAVKELSGYCHLYWLAS